MRPYAQFGAGDDWGRGPGRDLGGQPDPFAAVHIRTTYDPDRCALTLAGWSADPCPPSPVGPDFSPPVPLAVDEFGRIIRIVFDGSVTRLDSARRSRNGVWTRSESVGLALAGRPLAACFDDRGLLWVADAGPLISIVDPQTGTVVEGVTRSGVRDLVRIGDRVLALSGTAVIEYDPCREWRRVPITRPCHCPLVAKRARRVVVIGHEVFVLWRAADGRAWLADLAGETQLDGLRWVSDVDTVGGHLLVGYQAGVPLTVHHRRGEGWPMESRFDGAAYDGASLIALPDGTVVTWPATAALPTSLPRLSTRYPTDGHATAARLDSGDFQTTWGRVFIDACTPPGTQIEVATACSDDEPPPSDVEFGPFGPLVTRPMGSERPWTSAADGYRTLEAPVTAPPGRYLWVRVQLIGPGSISPSVRQVRAEYPSHDLLRRLPSVYSRDPVAADFLRRLLAPAEAMFAEMDTLAWTRDFLLHAAVAPAETLTWLAGFVGLAVDERWPLPARRRIIARAAALFARRGTVASLEEFCRLALGTRVVIVERFRLFGSGDAPPNRPIGTGWRVGDRLGNPDDVEEAADGELDLGAHQFVVTVWRALNEIERDVLARIMDLHRPAHTVWSLCTLDGRSVVGQELLGVSSMLGRSGFLPAVLGGSPLGGGRTIGAGHPRRDAKGAA